MTDQPAGSDGTLLRRWMIAVGIFFLLLGVGLLPWVNDARIGALGLEALYTGGDLTTDDTAYRYLLDWLGVFGASLFVLGAMLLVASRDPVRNRAFAHLVIWHELIVGVVSDAWFISRDYIPNGAYVGFIVLHLIVIATGVWALRRTPPRAEASRSEASRSEAEVR